MVLEIVRGVTGSQNSSLMPTLYPGRLMTTPQLFSVADMWAAFEVLATNKAPAIRAALPRDFLQRVFHSYHHRPMQRTTTTNTTVVLSVQRGSATCAKYTASCCCWRNVLSKTGAVAILDHTQQYAEEAPRREVVDGVVVARSSDRSQSPINQLAADRSSIRARCAHCCCCWATWLLFCKQLEISTLCALLLLLPGA